MRKKRSAAVRVGGNNFRRETRRSCSLVRVSGKLPPPPSANSISANILPRLCTLLIRQTIRESSCFFISRGVSYSRTRRGFVPAPTTIPSRKFQFQTPINLAFFFFVPTLKFHRRSACQSTGKKKSVPREKYRKSDEYLESITLGTFRLIDVQRGEKTDFEMTGVYYSWK